MTVDCIRLRDKGLSHLYTRNNETHLDMSRLMQDGNSSYMWHMSQFGSSNEKFDVLTLDTSWLV